MNTVILNATNCEMPLVGLGTWQTVDNEELELALNTALNCGYRSIDTAFNYNNEEAIGKVLSEWLSKNKCVREDLFITTKLPHIANRAEDVEIFLKLSLAKLNLSYVDLYLIHVPFGFERDDQTMAPKVNQNGDIVLDMTTNHITLWKAMEDVMNKGLTKNIGLSNFNETQIEAICEEATIIPQVLQIECHMYLQQVELRKFCADRNIAITAYSPLGSPGAFAHFNNKYKYQLQNCPDLIGHPSVTTIAANYNKTPSQILLKFLVQQNIVVIPKSSNPQRIEQNIRIFDFTLNDKEMEDLKELDKGDDGRIIDFMFWKGVENHPQYPFPAK